MNKTEIDTQDRMGTFRISHQLYDRLEWFARHDRRSVSFMVREAVEEYVENRTEDDK